MIGELKRPGAGTHRASSQLLRYTRNRAVQWTHSQASRFVELDAAKARVSIADAWHALERARLYQELPAIRAKLAATKFAKRETRHGPH